MSAEYRIGKTEVRRIGPDKLELKINTEKAEVFTEDLAALVASELPEDRARELLSSCEEERVRKGKVKVVVSAHKDIKKGEPVSFVLDITRYVGASMGIRTSKSGIIF